MARFKKVSDVYEMKVFTDGGYFFGEIEEAIIEDNKITSWKIRAVPGSILMKNINEAKGVILPCKYFKSFGDIIIVEHVEIGMNQSEETAL